MTNPKLAADAVTSDKVADDALTSRGPRRRLGHILEIATDAVGSDEIATDAVGSDEIVDASDDTNELADGSVTKPQARG